MRFIGEILAVHVPGVAAEGNLAHGIDTPVGNESRRGIPANLVRGDDALAGDDEFLGRPGEVVVGHQDALGPAVAVDVRLVDVDQADIGEQGGDEQVIGAREGALDHLGPAVLERVRPHHVADRVEGNAGAGGLVTDGQGVVRPLRHLDLAAFHVLPGIGRQAARLEADDVGHVDAVEALTRCKDLEIVGRRMAGQPQVLLPLPHDFMKHCGGDAVDAETADGNVVPVFYVLLDRFLYGHDLALQLPALVAEELTSLVRIRIRKNLANSLC